MTAPAHPVVFRPIIRLLREAGHEVEVTARDYAQNIALLRRMGMDHTVVGPGHGGASRLGKARALAGRTRAMRHSPPAGLRPRGRARLQRPRARGRLAADPRRQHVRLRVRGPAAQHRLPARAPRDDAGRDPAERLERYGVGPDKLVQYAGLKEEYYLSDFTPDPASFDRLGVDARRSW
jgi:hypothetical protein